MPHLSLTPLELDEQYPSMRAPADDRMEDVLKDEDDTVFKHGMQIAAEIRAAMRVNGRTRYRATTDFVGLLCEPVSSVAGPRAAVPRDTSHGERRPWYPQRGADVPPGTVVGSLERRQADDFKKKYEPNYDKKNFLETKKCICSTTAGIAGSTASQACREVQVKEENDDYDNNHNGYQPVANTICRRSARDRYPLVPTTATTTALTSSMSSPRRTSEYSDMRMVWSHGRHVTALRRFLVSSFHGRLAQIAASLVVYLERSTISC
jgi:hypothetical protein